MDTLGLTEAARTTYRRLSGGQQQRLALACAVVGTPGAGVPRRADRGHGRARANRGVGLDRRAAPRRRHRRADHPPADRGRGAGRPDGDHRPRRRGGHRHSRRADAQRRREPAAVLARRRMLDLSLLVSALPESYKATEAAPGEYLVEGHIDPQVLATVTAWCARLDVLATDMRVEQRSLEDVFLDLTGAGAAVVTNRFAPGTFTPDPRPATVQKMLAAQFGLELKLLLRNGEQLLLTMFIPITLLVGLTLLPLGSFGAEPGGHVRARDHGARGDLDGVHRAGHRGGVRPPLRRAETARRDGAAGVGHHRGQVARRRDRGVPAVDPVGRHRFCAGLAARHRRAGARRGDHRARHRGFRRARACCSAARCGPRSCWRSPTCCGSSSPASAR